MTIPPVPGARPEGVSGDSSPSGRASTIDRRAVAVIAAEGDDDAIEAFVAALPTERLAPAILQIRELRQALQRVESWCESRYGSEVGTPYVDPETREMYTWSGEAKWSITDSAGLVSELRKLAAARPAFAARIHSAFEQVWKIDNRVLNSIRDLDEEIGDAIREFRVRSYGPKHLRKWEDPPGQVKQ